MPAREIRWPSHVHYMRHRSLLLQVLLVNMLLMAVAVLVATLGVNTRTAGVTHGREALVFGLAIVATLLGNWLLLRRRFAPLDEMISAMETVDLADPARRPFMPAPADSAEVLRLDAAFQRMIRRLEDERRRAGRAAIHAQERERRRIAQDLHDEVNQALTAVSLRLQASIEHAPPELRRELTETKRLSSQAMEELLVLARQLRPALLDDHGLVPALHSQVRDFADQTGDPGRVQRSRYAATALARAAARDLPRDPGILSNIAQHADAGKVDVELSFVGRTILRISDDGQGFDGGRNGGLGLSGMRERALLAGGRCRSVSRPGRARAWS